VTESVQSWVHSRYKERDGCVNELMFRPMMRWLDRNVEDLFTDALKQVSRYRYTSAYQ